MTQMEDPTARLRQEALLFEYAQCQDEANSVALRTQAVIIVIYTGNVAALLASIGPTATWAHVSAAWIGLLVSVILMWSGRFHTCLGPVVFLQRRAEFTRNFMFSRQREIERELNVIKKSSAFTAAEVSRDSESADRFDRVRGNNAGIAMIQLGWVIEFIWFGASAATTIPFALSRLGQ